MGGGPLSSSVATVTACTGPRRRYRPASRFCDAANRSIQMKRFGDGCDASTTAKSGKSSSQYGRMNVTKDFYNRSHLHTDMD